MSSLSVPLIFRPLGVTGVSDAAAACEFDSVDGMTDEHSLSDAMGPSLEMPDVFFLLGRGAFFFSPPVLLLLRDFFAPFSGAIVEGDLSSIVGALEQRKADENRETSAVLTCSWATRKSWAA